MYAQCISVARPDCTTKFGSCAAVVVQIMRLYCAYKYTKGILYIHRREKKRERREK